LGSGLANYQTKHYKYNGISWTSVSTLPYKFGGSEAVVYKKGINILGSSTSDYNKYHYEVAKEYFY
jgi:hypothetical protein